MVRAAAGSAATAHIPALESDDHGRITGFATGNPAARVGIAEACACGVYSPQQGAGVGSKETALVRAAPDETEDIYLSSALDPDVRSGALLFPVPDRHAEVDRRRRRANS